MFKDLSKSRKKALIVIGVLLLIAIGIGTSYSYFQVNTTYDGTLSVINGNLSCLDITYNEQNTLNLTNQYPVTDDWALANMTPVTVTVTNNCVNTTDRINYTLALTTLKNSTGYILDNQVRAHVKRTLPNDTEKIFKQTDYLSNYNVLPSGNALDYITQDLSTRGLNTYATKTNYIIDSNSVGVGETNTYKIYLWMDYYEGDTTHTGLNDNSTENKQFKSTLSLVLNADSNVEEGFDSAFEKLTTLATGITKYNGKVTDTVDQIGTGVDATKVYAFTSNDNNNLVFANHCWQIRRTTENGGIKIQYNGEPTLGTSNGKTTYDCGTTRAGKMQDVYKTTTSLYGTYLYGTGYTTSVSGNTTTFTLTGTESVQVTSSNASTVIPTLVGKYTCRNSTGSCTNTSLYKVDGQSSSYYAYAYTSTYRDSLGISVFTSNNNSIADVGYMYNTRYARLSKTISGSQTISSSSTYVIGDGISDNGDGTFTLTGTVNTVAGSSWNTDYANYVNKYVCMPGYYTNTSGTYTCSDNGAQDVGALRYITATTSTNFKGTRIYKYGYGIVASGSSYTLTAKNGEPQTLQYITNWPSTETSNCFADSNTKISTCGYKTLSKSHYTCYNLSGICSTYYYANNSDASSLYSIPISGGKYVSTDLADTNNVLYEMLNTSNLNTTNSTIKGVVDSWYESNLLNTTYESLIDRSTIFCNDRRITSYGAWNPDGGTPADGTNYELKFTEYSSTSNLGCNRVLDAFSIENNSAHLNYPIGLMSNPEMNILGSNTPRSAASGYWLSSPLYLSLSSFGRYVDSSGSLAYNNVNLMVNVRPAVSLASSASFSSGTGSTTDPFVVKGSEMTP